MQMTWLWVSSGIAFIAFFVHTYVGGPRVAVPLLNNADLPFPSKWLNYMCWHIATIALLLCSAGLAWAAYTNTAVELVVFIAAFSGLAGIWSAVVARMARLNPFRFPSTSLLAGVSISAIYALLG